MLIKKKVLTGTVAAAALACALVGTAAFADGPAATTVTGDDVQTYCGLCHFATVENASIASWNGTNIDVAMVESMVPMLDDGTIQAIADYFAAIEPPAQEEGQH